MKKTATNIPHSIHQKLLNVAKETNKPFNMVLQHYVIERFLYRVANSRYADKLLLKGALLLKIWQVPIVRPTMDIDMLGKIENKNDIVENILKDCMEVKVENDGLIFYSETLEVETISENAEYQDIRFRFLAKLGSAKVALQVDIGVGDVIYPKPMWIDYPSILSQEKPHLLAYTPESMIAEKYQAMVTLEMANSRMKDFYDIWLLASNLEFQGKTLFQAIKKTFERRNTVLPSSIPVCLSRQFYEGEAKQKQWSAFINKSGLKKEALSLKGTVEFISDFLMPPTLSAFKDGNFELDWPPKGPWK